MPYIQVQVLFVIWSSSQGLDSCLVEDIGRRFYPYRDGLWSPILTPFIYMLVPSEVPCYIDRMTLDLFYQTVFTQLTDHTIPLNFSLYDRPYLSDLSF